MAIAKSRTAATGPFPARHTFVIDPDDSVAVARDMIGERKSVMQDEEAAEPEDLAAKDFPEGDLSGRD